MEAVKEKVRLQKYPAYKDSGVEWLGEIPEHWKILKLKFLLSSNDGGVWNDFITDDGIPVFRSTEINVDGSWNTIEPIRLSLTDKELEKSKLVYNDLIVTKSSGSPEHIGKTAIYQKTEVASYSNFTQRLRLNKFNQARFYFYVLNSNISKYQYQVLTKSTSGLGNLNGEILGNIFSVQPSYTEQTAIAGFLDEKCGKIDTAIAQKEKLIELLKERKQIIIQNAVTKGLDPNVKMKDSEVEWIGKIPEHWKLVKNKTLFQESNKPGEEGLPLLMVSIHSAVSSEEMNDEDNIRGRVKIEDKTKYKLVNEHDVVFNMMRAWQGAIGAVSVKGLVSPAYIVATPNKKIDSKYFEHQYRTDSFIQQMNQNSKGITDFRKRLYWDEFKQLLTVLPPKEEQIEIVEKIKELDSKIENAIALQQQQIERLKEYKSSLIDAAVTGKIKVS